MDNLIKIVTKPDNVAIVIMMVMVIFFTWVAFYQAMKNDRSKKKSSKEPPKNIRKGNNPDDKVYAWPFLARKEFLIAILVMVFLLAWSIWLDAPLEEKANPTLTPNPAKA
ncbi:MAG: cytochrome C, partial [Fidelibacterota bacterium]